MFVKNNKASINGNGAGTGLDIDGVGMATESGILFKQRYLMMFAQQPGAAQARNAGANDGDFRISHAGNARKSVVLIV